MSLSLFCAIRFAMVMLLKDREVMHVTAHTHIHPNEHTHTHTHGTTVTNQEKEKGAVHIKI